MMGREKLRYYLFFISIFLVFISSVQHIGLSRPLHHDYVMSDLPTEMNFCWGVGEFS